jgi:hypothetical protein
MRILDSLNARLDRPFWHWAVNRNSILPINCLKGMIKTPLLIFYRFFSNDTLSGRRPSARIKIYNYTLQRPNCMFKSSRPGFCSVSLLIRPIRTKAQVPAEQAYMPKSCQVLAGASQLIGRCEAEAMTKLGFLLRINFRRLGWLSACCHLGV